METTSKIIKDCINGTIKTEEILKRMKIITAKLDKKDKLEWINNEINGYEKEVPNYRKVQGVPLADIQKGIHILKNMHLPTPKFEGDDDFDPSIIGYGESLSILEKALNTNGQIGRPVDLELAQTWGMLVNVNGYVLQLRIIVNKEQISGIIECIRNTALEILLEMEKEHGILNKYDPTIDCNKKMIILGEEMKEDLKKNKVFIVHGQDNETKNIVARFVEKLGLEAIILHEQASKGKTIIEKIEAYTDVGFGIVLYTPCDFGKSKHDKELKPRTRQNVIFEHGYLIGKIGRSNVCALLTDDSLEKPNDISGVVYISMNNLWRLELANEMKHAGYEIDLNKLG
ncbi:MAG: nucleotide-binding protein [Fusobacteriaceae bacterium]|nr:nucleotide-binding protein [Fusobacteriaceae bacterium]